MKRLLKPLLIGLACGAISFPVSAWAAFWLLLRYHGFDQVPTDPDNQLQWAVGPASFRPFSAEVLLD